jgi:predicted permease
VSLLGELVLALRTLRRAPASAAIAVFALGVGIGLSTLIFSIIQGAMLRGLPFDEPHELVRIFRTNVERGGRILPTIHDYAAWGESGRSFGGLGAYYTGTVNLSGSADQIPERMRGAFVTPSVFELLGVQAAAGRLLRADDDDAGAPAVILLGWEVWHRRFDGDPAVVGRTVRANGVDAVIVGVLPERFGFPESQQVWLPLRLDANQLAWGAGQRVQVAGRLSAGVGVEAATADLARVAQRIAEEHPETHRSQSVEITDFSVVGDNDRALLFIMFGAVMAVLIIACVNVANLLIGRAIMRTKEVGIRMALGASRLRVATPFLAESAVLALGGAVLGVGVAYAGLGVFNRSVELHNPPFWIYFSINGLVFAFVALAGAVAAVLAGVIPAIQAASLALHDTLKDESRGATGFRLGRVSRALVVAEIALSVGLLAAAGVMVRSVLKLNTIDLGVRAENVFVARVGLPERGYGTRDAQRRFAANLLDRLRALPGVQSTAIASALPGRGDFGSAGIGIEGQARDDDSDVASAIVPIVSIGYFDMFEATPLRGRDFTPADDAGATPVAIVNLSFERRYFPDGEALGRRVRVGGQDSPWLTVVGVVPDLLESGVQNWRPEALYRPLAQSPVRFMTIAARLPSNPLALTGPVLDQVRAIDPDLPIYDVATLRTSVQDANFMTGILGGLFAAFGVAALVLASVGLYGVMAFSVDQRRREVGIRMAIGARPRNVLSLIMLQGMRQVLLGLAIGAFFAFALTRAIASSLFGVSPQDPLAFAATVFVLLAIAALACGVPALRATRVDPLEALRSE